MKKKIFAALLSLAAIAGIAIAENEPPILRTTPYGTVNAHVGDEFTFLITYQFAEQIVITADSIENDNCWIWWWDRGVAEPNTITHSGVIHTQYTTRKYTITAHNGRESSNARLDSRNQGSYRNRGGN